MIRFFMWANIYMAVVMFLVPLLRICGVDIPPLTDGMAANAIANGLIACLLKEAA